MTNRTVNPNALALTRKLEFIIETKGSLRRNPLMAGFAIKVANATGYSPSTVLAVLAGKNLNETIITYMYDYMVSLTGKTLSKEDTTNLELKQRIYEQIDKGNKMAELMADVQYGAEEIVKLLEGYYEAWNKIDDELPYDLPEDLKELSGGYDKVGRIKITQEYWNALKVLRAAHVKKTEKGDYIGQRETFGFLDSLNMT